MFSTMVLLTVVISPVLPFTGNLSLPDIKIKPKVTIEQKIEINKKLDKMFQEYKAKQMIARSA